MERMLQKMAAQLNGYDEASLTSLWENYARKVQEFEPSRRWEEAALIFSFIQAVRLKNQLFNHNLARQAQALRGDNPPRDEFTREVSAWSARKKEDESVGSDGGKADTAGKKRCKVLHFRRSKSDKPV